MAPGESWNYNKPIKKSKPIQMFIIIRSKVKIYY